MKKILSYSLLAALVACAASCTKLDLDDLGDVTYSPSLVLPLGSLKLDMGHLIKSVDSTYIQTDTVDDLFYFEWEMPKVEVSAIDLDNYAKGGTLNSELQLLETGGFGDIFDGLPASENELPLPEGDYEFAPEEETYPFEYNENIPGEKQFIIYSCALSTATLRLDVDIDGVELDTWNYMTVDITFPDIIYTDGNPLSLKGKITSKQQTLEQVYTSFPVDFGKSFEDDVVRVAFSYTLHSDGDMLVSRNAGIDYSMQFDLIGFHDIQGFFWQKSPLSEDKMEIEIPDNAIFDKLTSGNNRLLFRDPQIRLHARSKAGVPFSAEIKSLVAEDNNGQSVAADFGGSPSTTIELPMATLDGDNIVPVDTTVLFDRESAGTNKLFTIVPRTIIYDWAVYARSDNRDETHFISEDTDIEFESSLRLPFVFDDKTSFSYDTVMDMSISGMLPEGVSLTALILNMDMKNMIPVAIDVRLDFLDDNGKVLFSGNPTTIDAAIVDDLGKAVEPSAQQLAIECKAETLDKILQASSVGVNVTMRGSDARKGIYFTPNDNVDIRISAACKVSATVGINETLNQ